MVDINSDKELFIVGSIPTLANKIFHSFLGVCDEQFFIRYLLDFCCCHTKRTLGWYEVSPGFFGYDTIYGIVLSCLPKWYLIVFVIPRVGMAGLVPPKPSFGMTTRKIVRPVFAWHWANEEEEEKGESEECGLKDWQIFLDHSAWKSNYCPHQG